MIIEPDVTQAQEKKFCKNCAHLLGNRNYPESWSTWKCDKTKSVQGVNLVTGELVFAAAFCSNVREDQTSCGTIGRWYEEYKRPSLLHPDNSISGEFHIKKSKKLTESDLSNL